VPLNPNQSISTRLGTPAVTCSCVLAGLPSGLVCEDRQVACSDGSKCIAEVDRCDDIPDCEDGSDEENCAATCSAGEFFCEADGVCFPTSYRCDGHEDCFDGSDEESCELRLHLCAALHSTVIQSVFRKA